MSVIDFNSLVNFSQNAFAETFDGFASAHRMDSFLTTVGKNGCILNSQWQNVTTNYRYVDTLTVKVLCGSGRSNLFAEIFVGANGTEDA